MHVCVRVCASSHFDSLLFPHPEALFLPGGTGIVTRKRAPHSADALASTAARVFNQGPSSVGFTRQHSPSIGRQNNNIGDVDNGGDDDDAEACVVRVRALLERYERNLASAFASLVPRSQQHLTLSEVALSPADLSSGLVSKYGVTNSVAETVADLLCTAGNGATDLPTFCQELCRTSSRLRDFHGSLDNGTLTPNPDSLETRGKYKAAATFGELNRSSLHMSTNLPVARSATPQQQHFASPLGPDGAVNSTSESFIREHGFGYVAERSVHSTPHRPASLNETHEETAISRRRLGAVEGSERIQQVGHTGSFKYNPITHKGGRPEDKAPRTGVGKLQNQQFVSPEMQSPSPGKWLHLKRDNGDPPVYQ